MQLLEFGRDRPLGAADTLVQAGGQTGVRLQLATKDGDTLRTVSNGGGTQPRWSADGKELYFIAPDGKLMAAPITSTATFAAGTPTALIPARLAPGGPANSNSTSSPVTAGSSYTSRLKSPPRPSLS